MKNKNFEYTGWKINGFVALILILVAIVGGVFMIVNGAEAETAAVGEHAQFFAVISAPRTEAFNRCQITLQIAADIETVKLIR